MSSPELTLVLSGHLRRPQSADLRPFWSGFIELQKKLPSAKPVRQIVAQSWNPELSSLVSAVYAPQAERHEQQACFYQEFIWQIEPPDLFERGLDRLSSTWKNVSIQSVLGNARARARAVELLDELPTSEGQVLITRWDLGQTGGQQVNQLVADATLPLGYIYMSYFSEVDEGYADMWVLAPWAEARKFGRFDAFVLDSLSGRNRYLELFTFRGWPQARVKSRFENWRSNPVWQRIHLPVLKLTQGLGACAQGNTALMRVVRRMTRSIQLFLSKPPVTAENSCVPGPKVLLPVFPAYQALNIHALLKYFIMEEGLRDRVRFLTSEDFDIAAQSGQLINPIPVTLFIYHADQTEIARLIEESPIPLAAVYQMGAGNVRQHIPDGEKRWIVSTLKATGSEPRDLLTCALDAELRRDATAVPTFIMPTVDRFLGCSDWFYLNALSKYLAWSGTGYVGLASKRDGKPHLEFPDLQMVRGGGALSLRIAAGTAQGMRSFLDSTGDPDWDLDDLSERADQMLLEFPVVVKDGGLF